MPEQVSLRGVWPMLATPFHPDGEPDRESLDRLVDHVRASGADGLSAFGLAAEAHALADAERRALGEAILARVAGRLPVLIAVSAESTALAVGLARHAERHGAAAVMLAPPRVTRSSAAELARYYGAVAESIGLPVMIQDAPGYIGVALGSALIAGIVRAHPNVRAVKTEALPASAAIAALRDELGDAVALFSGNGGLYLLDTLRGGAVGAIPGCDIPERFVAIVKAYMAGRTAEASARFARLLPLLVYQNQSLDLYVACTKAVLAHRGVIAHAGPRAPAPGLAAEAHLELIELYRDLA